MLDSGFSEPTAAGGLSARQYAVIQDFLERHVGIRLGPDKEYLVVSRLGRLLSCFGISGFSELVDRLSEADQGDLQAAVVDAMTTNETFWFRDAVHFRVLTDAILAETERTSLRVWSAAASTGQEAYTVSICLQDAMQLGRVRRSLDYQILGTDISATSLGQARTASYCGVSAARGLNDDQRRRYFRERQGCLELLPLYRQRVSFRTFNLLQPFDLLGRFDVIFCRNVLIYFSQERKREIILRIARALHPGGHLFLGSTESMSGYQDLFEMRNLQGGLVYRRRS